MNTYQLKTDLHCENCRTKLKAVLDKVPQIKNWNVDLVNPDKTLTLTGDVSREEVIGFVEKAGYHVLETAPSFLATYRPLILIFGFILGVTLLIQFKSGSFHLHEAMAHFMAGFFLVFSFFKFLNLKGFKDAYASYDLIAKMIPNYGYVYPFFELFLGVAFIFAPFSHTVYLLTILLMGVSSIGVLQSVLKKSKIQCACLGTVFDLPMTYVTLFEDLLMVFMSMAMLFL